MENPATTPANERIASRHTVRPGTEPVVLVLPRRTEDAAEESGGSVLEQLQVIETGSGPEIESALLIELLSRSPDLGRALADSTEVHSYPHPLSAVNAYKHRLHALRCEYVNLRRRLTELENEIEQMRASRCWRLTERCSRWLRLLGAKWGVSANPFGERGASVR